MLTVRGIRATRVAASWSRRVIHARTPQRCLSQLINKPPADPVPTRTHTKIPKLLRRVQENESWRRVKDDRDFWQSVAAVGGMLGVFVWATLGTAAADDDTKSDKMGDFFSRLYMSVADYFTNQPEETEEGPLPPLPESISMLMHPEFAYAREGKLLPPQDPTLVDQLYPRTLIIELEGAFLGVIYDHRGWIVRKRWGFQSFLKRMKLAGYEIIVYTRLPKWIAEPICNELDPEHLFFSHRLFKDSHARRGLFNQHYLKEFEKLNRDPSRAIMILSSSDKKFIRDHHENVLYVDPMTWRNNDKGLINPIMLLEGIARWESNDVRTVLQAYAKNPQGSLREIFGDRVADDMEATLKGIGEDRETIVRNKGPPAVSPNGVIRRYSDGVFVNLGVLSQHPALTLEKQAKFDWSPIERHYRTHRRLKAFPGQEHLGFANLEHHYHHAVGTDVLEREQTKLGANDDWRNTDWEDPVEALEIMGYSAPTDHMEDPEEPMSLALIQAKANKDAFEIAFEREWKRRSKDPLPASAYQGKPVEDPGLPIYSLMRTHRVDPVSMYAFRQHQRMERHPWLRPGFHVEANHYTDEMRKERMTDIVAPESLRDAYKRLKEKNQAMRLRIRQAGRARRERAAANAKRGPDDGKSELNLWEGVRDIYTLKTQDPNYSYDEYGNKMFLTRREHEQRLLAEGKLMEHAPVRSYHEMTYDDIWEPTPEEKWPYENAAL